MKTYSLHIDLRTSTHCSIRVPTPVASEASQIEVEVTDASGKRRDCRLLLESSNDPTKGWEPQNICAQLSEIALRPPESSVGLGQDVIVKVAHAPGGTSIISASVGPS